MARSVVLRGVTPDHPPGVIPRDPAAGDAGAMAEDDVARLRGEVEELRAANAKLESKVARRARLRRAAVVLLLVLGCGFFAASLIALWTRATVLNTDRYVDTMAPIAASPAVQQAVADKLATRINGAIDFNALAREALPERADTLAPAIAAGAQTAIREGLDRFVASDRFQELWNEANRRAHDRVVALLTTGESGRLALQGDTVYLDLSAAVDRLKERLRERGFNRVADAIPASVDGRIPLLTSDGFSSARRGIDIIKGLSILLPLLALLCFAGHILLTRPRRRGWLRVALGLTVTGLLLLAAVGIGRTAYLDAINQAVLPRQAASDIFDALIGLFRTTIRLTVIAAIVLAALSLLAGKPARAAAAAAGPRLRAAGQRVAGHPGTAWLAAHKAAVQWGVVLLGGLVLVAWDNPTAWVVLIDAALIALAVWLVAVLARSGPRVAA
jgi:hypothetical protein